MGGIKGKMYAMKHRSDKIQIRKIITLEHECHRKIKVDEIPTMSSVPSYLVERGYVDAAKHSTKVTALKRKENFGKWKLPLTKVRPLAEKEAFKVQKSGERGKKSWKRMVTKVT